MKFGWKVLIPFSLAWILIVSTLRVMSQQGAPPILIGSFIFSVALIYVAISSLLDKKKAAIREASKIIDASTPDFPVPAIPNSRTEQING